MAVGGGALRLLVNSRVVSGFALAAATCASSPSAACLLSNLMPGDTVFDGIVLRHLLVYAGALGGCASGLWRRLGWRLECKVWGHGWGA